MLNKLSFRPGVFDYLPDCQDNLYFEVTAEDLHCAFVAVQVVLDTGHIHIQVPKWTKIAGKMIVQDFQKLKEILIRMGVKTLVASNENIEDEERWTKFIELFGFPAPDKILVSTREI